MIPTTPDDTAGVARPPHPHSYDFTVKDLVSNKDVPLSAYKGKVSLIVNVASK
jgi:glutathione peroxidase-family protein